MGQLGSGTSRRRIFPRAAQVVDFYHAKEHLHDLAKDLAATLGEAQPAWLAARIDELRAGDIEGLLAAGREIALEHANATELEKALAYFETNIERMRYGAFRQAGHFVGSGTVESGCKSVVGQRLKLSGMRWSIRGADAIVTLRCEEASDRWEQIWERLGTQTGAA